MKEIFENSRIELKLQLNQNFEKEVVGFLNSKEGGNIYIGISDKNEVVGVNKDIDAIQLEIKDRIKNNISPTPLGLFDIVVETLDNKNIIHVVIASGNEKPYYLRKLGMTTDGCFIRVGSATESMTSDMITSMFSKRTRNSLRNVVSPLQKLSFSQLKIYYEEKGYSINDNFLNHLSLFTEDNKYNYLAHLLSDNNTISVKVAKYKGQTSYDLIENEEYGFNCLVKTTKNIINKMNLENKTYTKITGVERREVKMVDEIALREAIVNALVHNDWLSEYPPKFEFFSDHLSISSSGGLPEGFTKQEFLNGFSAPRHPELMRVFKDLGLVEQLGTGIARILKIYSKQVFDFYPNFIRINLSFEETNQSLNDMGNVTNETLNVTNETLNVTNETLNDTNETLNDTNETLNLTEIQRQILQLIEKKPKISQKELAETLNVVRQTIARQIRALKPEIKKVRTETLNDENDIRNDTNDIRNDTNDIRNDTNDIRNLTEIQTQIVMLMIENPRITQNDIARMLGVGIATVARHIKVLLDLKIITREGPTKKTIWRVIKYAK